MKLQFEMLVLVLFPVLVQGSIIDNKVTGARYKGNPEDFINFGGAFEDLNIFDELSAGNLQDAFESPFRTVVTVHVIPQEVIEDSNNGAPALKSSKMGAITKLSEDYERLQMRRTKGFAIPGNLFNFNDNLKRLASSKQWFALTALSLQVFEQTKDPHGVLLVKKYSEGLHLFVDHLEKLGLLRAAQASSLKRHFGLQYPRFGGSPERKALRRSLRRREIADFGLYMKYQSREGSSVIDVLERYFVE